jgi:hypothetical protein
LDKKKGIVAYILKDPLPGTVPLVRFHANGDSNDHFMTIDQKEAERIVREGSYEFDKILGYVGENPLPNTVPLKRFFYPPDIFDKYGHHDYCLCDGTEKSYGQQIEKYHEKMKDTSGQNRSLSRKALTRQQKAKARLTLEG